jgi:hypothetical protein
MRGDLAVALLGAVLLSGCVSGFGYPGYAGPYRSYSPPYYREYDAPYYGNNYWGWGSGGISRDEARDMAREQAAQQRRLQRRQQERRQDLLDQQSERREQKQSSGTWTKRNVSWQKQQRQQQNQRFQEQRENLKKWQDQQWDH